MRKEKKMNKLNEKWAKLSVGLKDDAKSVLSISQSFSYYKVYDTELFNSMRLSYYNDLIDAFKKKELKSFFEHLEATPHIAFITKELLCFLKKQLETRNPQSISIALHSIHSLILNKYAKPNVCASILTNSFIVSYLFDAKYEQHFGSFSFLIKEVAADILSDFFANNPKKKWAKSVLNELNNVFNKDGGSEESPLAVITNLCCQCFYDCTKEHFTRFYAISVYLAVGIEKLSQNFYPSLKAFYKYIFAAVPVNSLLNQCISKVWDKLLLFCEQWIKYYLIEKKPKDYSESDCFILRLGCVRYRMRYDYVISDIGYVPCEYPVVPRNSDFPSNKSGHYFSFSDVHFNARNVDDDIIEEGTCENLDQSNSSCVQNCNESLSESIFDIDESEMEIVESDINEIMESDINEIYEHITLSDSFCLDKPSMFFEDFDSMDVDVTCDEISDIYDSFVKYDTSYSFSDPCLKFKENFKMPNLESFRDKKIKTKKGYWSLI